MEKVSAAMGVALMEPFLGTHVAIEQIRRVVTGYSADGKSVIASDTRVAGSVGPTKPNFTDFGVPTSCRPTRMTVLSHSPMISIGFLRRAAFALLDS